MRRLTFLLVGLLAIGCDNFEKKFNDRIDEAKVSAIRNGSDTLDLATITDFEWDSVALIRGDDSVPISVDEIEKMLNRHSGGVDSEDRQPSSKADSKLKFKTSDLPTYMDRFYFLTPDKRIIEKEIEWTQTPFDLNYCLTDSLEERFWLSKKESRFIVKYNSTTIDRGTVLLFPDCVTEFSASDVKPSDTCIFNNDFKLLTTEWLAKAGRTNFIWQEDLASALIPMGSDTLYVQEGGCDHFIFSVELRLGNDGHSLSDTTFWLAKAQSLAIEFEFDHYKKAIGQRKFRSIEIRENSIWFDFEDDDPEDNTIYNGIEVIVKGKSKIISLVQYMN